VRRNKYIFFLILFFSIPFILLQCGYYPKEMIGGSITYMTMKGTSTSKGNLDAHPKDGIVTDEIRDQYNIPEYINYLITPEKIAGKIVSVILECPESGDCIPLFGNDRPDQLVDAEFYDFDLSVGTTITAPLNYRTDVESETSYMISAFYAYFDVTFSLGDEQKVIRYVYGPYGDYQRGDKLILRDGKFQWYDLETNEFTDTRPENPLCNETIRDFKTVYNLPEDDPDYCQLFFTLNEPFYFDRKKYYGKNLYITLNFTFDNSVGLKESDINLYINNDSKLLEDFELIAYPSSPGQASNSLIYADFSVKILGPLE